jgi:AcrR family transcriptional regulator
MDCTIEVLMKKGYHDTNLRDIADGLGIGRTTIYQYFKNKDEIINTVINLVFKRLENECEAIIGDPYLTKIDKLKAIINVLADDCQREKSVSSFLINLWVILKMENSFFREKVENHVATIMGMIRSTLEEGIKSREIRDINPESMSLTIYGLIQSFIINRQIYHNASIIEQLNNINFFIESLRI